MRRTKSQSQPLTQHLADDGKLMHGKMLFVEQYLVSHRGTLNLDLNRRINLYDTEA